MFLRTEIDSTTARIHIRTTLSGCLDQIYRQEYISMHNSIV